MKKTPFEIFSLYCAIKSHFTSKKYNAVLYNYSVRIKEESFLKRKDKVFFSMLTNHADAKGFLISILVRNPNVWFGDMIKNYAEAEAVYKDWKRRQKNLRYTFTEDLKKLNLKTCLKVKDGQHPEALIAMMQGKISIETLAILTDFTEACEVWDAKLKDDVVYDRYGLILRKYRYFLTYDRNEYKMILSRQLERQHEGD